jgi:hypothetical protein
MSRFYEGGACVAFWFRIWILVNHDWGDSLAAMRENRHSAIPAGCDKANCTGWPVSARV